MHTYFVFIKIENFLWQLTEQITKGQKGSIFFSFWAPSFIHLAVVLAFGSGPMAISQRCRLRRWDYAPMLPHFIEVYIYRVRLLINDTRQNVNNSACVYVRNRFLVPAVSQANRLSPWNSFRWFKDVVPGTGHEERNLGGASAPTFNNIPHGIRKVFQMK